MIILLFAISSCNPFKEDSQSESGFCAHPSSECSDSPPIIVDKTPPTLINVTLPVQDIFESGEILEIALEFDEPVTIAGSFSLVIEVGRYNKMALCAQNSNQWIYCRYTFQENSTHPDLDFNGIVFNSFDDSSGQIEDSAGNKANLSLGIPDLSYMSVYFTGLTNWMDANDPSTLFSDSLCSVAAVDGGPVGCWKDKRFSQPATSTGASRPVYSNDSAPSLRGSVYFNSDYLEYQAAATIDSEYTVVTVNNVVAFNTLNYIIGSISNVTNGIGFGFGGSWGGAAGNGLFSISKSAGATITRSFVSTQEPTAWGINTFQTTNIYRNDLEALPYAVAETLVLPQTFLRIGGRDDGNTCCNNNGELAELFIFNQKLTSNELQELWCHISDKYALALPSCL